MHDLVRWLQERILPRLLEIRAEEYEQRLESDESAVTIVTIHRSKGLQYPVVFCPFLWDQAALREGRPFPGIRVLLRYFPSAPGDEESREAARRENLAEKLRPLLCGRHTRSAPVLSGLGNFQHCEDSAAWYFLATWKIVSGSQRSYPLKPAAARAALKRAWKEAASSMRPFSPAAFPRISGYPASPA